LQALIEVKDLRTSFKLESGSVRAVNGVSFSIKRERTLGVVGESGCGKSVTALSIMGLIRNPGRIESGKIFFNRNGKTTDLIKLDPKGPEMRSIRGNDIAMIFQEPMTFLNPVFSIGNQIMESIMLHQQLNRKVAREKAIDMLRSVNIPSPESRIKEYPHQLSGGMRQRAMIAMALCCNPSLLIADEPTTALDVTIQAQVLSLINNLRTEFKASIMFITHDLGVIAHMADDVVIMYLGRIVESAPVRDIFRNPCHPYTQGLMSSIPSLTTKRDQPLVPIKGMVPDLLKPIDGCGFFSRCPQAMENCREESPGLIEISPGHHAACWLIGR